MYLPGFGQEYGGSVDFVQNFLAGLDYRWKDKLTFNVEFNYTQNPTYFSRGRYCDTRIPLWVLSWC